MPDLPILAPPVPVLFVRTESTGSTPSRLWRGVRSVGITCGDATPEQCGVLLAAAQQGAPVPVDGTDTVALARVQLTADLTRVGDRLAIRLSARPAVMLDDAQGEWAGPTLVARDDEDFAALARRALDRALPWRAARQDVRTTGEIE